MNDFERPPEAPEVLQGDIFEQIKQLGELFREKAIPHAFGGAIALIYYKEPRSTTDIDVNVFLPRNRHQDVTNALESMFPIDADEKALFAQRVMSREQGEVRWQGTRIDIFFAGTEFHDSMADRVRQVTFAGKQISILSPEDLIICKATFDRDKDWVDIEGVCVVQQANLDLEYISAWLNLILPDGDPRIARATGLIVTNQ